MSLRVFHIIFIIGAIIGTDYFAFWAMRHHLIDKAPQSFFWMALGALIGSFFLLIYLLWYMVTSKLPSNKK